MKKIVTIVIMTLSVQAAYAHGAYSIDGETMRILASITVLVLFMVFILAILKRYLDHKLKNKIVDKGVSENIASSILQASTGESRNSNIKWFLLLAGIGAGLTFVHYTRPLGIHSLAIMSISVSLSFLAYYFFVKQGEK